MMQTLEFLTEHARIIWAIMLREVATRYGRNNIGFLWVFGEPAAFCIGVLILYRSIRGPYEHSLDIVPFVLTGYMPMILVRHIVTYSINAIKMNNALLYHKQISVLDLYIGRVFMEFVGVTFAGVVIYVALLIFGLAPVPVDLGMVYTGWMLDALAATGMALILGAISDLVEIVERIVSVALYILVPLSGTFYLADWLPPDVRRFALLLPFLNVSEMIRYGFFGASVHAHYDIGYTAMCGIVMTVIGLLLVRQVRERIEVF
jgi:capsular polysaccharide transport system permease protein